jgi:hypothetical protein
LSVIDEEKRFITLTPGECSGHGDESKEKEKELEYV